MFSLAISRHTHCVGSLFSSLFRNRCSLTVLSAGELARGHVAREVRRPHRAEPSLVSAGYVGRNIGDVDDALVSAYYEVARYWQLMDDDFEVVEN